MMSICSVLFTLLMFSEMSRHLVPAASADDGVMEADAVGSLLADEPMTDRGAIYRQSFAADKQRDEDGNPKIIIISELRQRSHGVRGLNSPFTRNLPLLTDRRASHPPTDLSLKLERRDSDLNMLRCMIGRVYRPCWETSGDS